MRQRITWLVLLSAAVAVGVLSYSAHVWATPASGFKATSQSPLAPSPNFEVFNHSVMPNPNGDGDNDRDDKMPWLSLQKTMGSSDLYVQSSVWSPVDLTTGAIASTGWHTHPATASSLLRAVP